jgi:transposase
LIVGLPAHRSKAMGAWLGRQRPWLVVEPLPGYAPELNPVEMGLSQCEFHRASHA